MSFSSAPLTYYQACSLISKIKRNGLILPEANPDQAGFPLRLPARAVARLTDPPEPQPETSQRDLHAEAEGLMAELAIWDNASTFTPYHPRTLYGNHSYRHAIRIRLLRELFGVPRDDPRVQTSCAAIIELGVEVLSLFGRITWYADLFAVGVALTRSGSLGRSSSPRST